MMIGGLVDRVLADNEETFVPLLLSDVAVHGGLRLEDGDELCLAGVAVPISSGLTSGEPAWQSEWHKIIERGAFGYQAGQPALTDRYGCRHGLPRNAYGVPLQHDLLAAGWAMVDPLSAPDEPSALDAMFALEAEARDAGLGIWGASELLPKSADDLDAWIGMHQLMEGEVRRISNNKRYVYLNFGSDWRTDFTARLDRKMIKRTGLDEAMFDGKKLRLRGVIEESRGPLMTITHPKQIEILP